MFLPSIFLNSFRVRVGVVVQNCTYLRIGDVLAFLRSHFGLVFNQTLGNLLGTCIHSLEHSICQQGGDRQLLDMAQLRRCTVRDTNPGHEPKTYMISQDTIRGRTSYCCHSIDTNAAAV